MDHNSAPYDCSINRIMECNVRCHKRLWVYLSYHQLILRQSGICHCPKRSIRAKVRGSSYNSKSLNSSICGLCQTWTPCSWLQEPSWRSLQQLVCVLNAATSTRSSKFLLELRLMLRESLKISNLCVQYTAQKSSNNVP